MAKLSLLVGFGAGYVLGSRAGRERYEQIRRAWSQAKEDPRLQEVAGMAQARADSVVNSVRRAWGARRPAELRATRSVGPFRGDGVGQLLPRHLPRRLVVAIGLVVEDHGPLPGGLPRHPARHEQHRSPAGQR